MRAGRLYISLLLPHCLLGGEGTHVVHSRCQGLRLRGVSHDLVFDLVGCRLVGFLQIFISFRLLPRL